MVLAPIIFFVYNRPEHTAKALKSLARNTCASESELFIFCDGPKNEADLQKVNLARQATKQAIGRFKRVTIHERQTNHGLARSVIAGVSEVIAEAGRAIVLEDDLVLGKGFLVFMNSLLRRYQEEEKVFSVTGYVFPHQPVADYPHDVVALPRSSTWGWGTWRDRWEKADWSLHEAARRIDDPDYVRGINLGGQDVASMVRQLLEGRIDSWGVPWYLTHRHFDAQAVYPVKNRVLNLGLDGSGVNCGVGVKSNRRLYPEPMELKLPRPLEDNTDLARNILAFFD